MPDDGLALRDEIQRAIEALIHRSWWPHLSSPATITSITENELASLTEIVHTLQEEIKHMAVTLEELTAHIKTSAEDTALLITSLPAYFEAVNALINEVKVKAVDTPLDFTEQVKAIDQADADVKAAIAQLSASKELFPAPAATSVVPPVEPVVPPVVVPAEPAVPIAPASVTVANDDGTTTVTTADGFVTTMNQNGTILPNP